MATEEYKRFVESLRALVDKEVRPCQAWYESHYTWPRVVFRIAGTIVIVSSVLLPVVASLKALPYREAALITLSMAVAIPTSLNAFFRWDSTWRSRTRTEGDLRGLLAAWELRLKGADLSDNPAQAALAATERLFREAYALVASETDQFFATVRWPESARPKDGA